MYATLPDTFPFRMPPRAEDLPWSDGEPMESDRHVKQMTLLIESLRMEWIDRKDVFIGGNMFVYFSESQAKKNDFRGPDVFVVLDAEEKERRLSWVVWEEGGRTPDVVIELTSASTEADDRGKKMDVCARRMRVSGYYLFDPLSSKLDGFSLDQDSRSYRPLVPLAGGDLPVSALGLRLGLRPGSYLGEGGPWLRWLSTDGRVIPTNEERAAEAQRKTAEAQRETVEAQREAAEAHQAAERLEARLRAYEARFGPING